jgi:hypothetical protein
MRGGTGVMCDNHFDDIPGKGEIKLYVFNIRRIGQVPCQTQYPAARRVGMGWSESGTISYPGVPQDGNQNAHDPIYIWNNPGGETTVNEYEPDECGNGQRIADYVQEGRDYFLNVAKPGYQKAPYPHWIRTESGGGPTPTPAPTPTAIPTPTAHPTPQPTPTPGPTPESYSKWLDDLARWIQGHPAHPNP